MKISKNNRLILALLSRCKDQLRLVLTGLYMVLKIPKSERLKTRLQFRSFAVLGICVLNRSWSGWSWSFSGLVTGLTNTSWHAPYPTAVHNSQQHSLWKFINYWALKQPRWLPTICKRMSRPNGSTKNSSITCGCSLGKGKTTGLTFCQWQNFSTITMSICQSNKHHSSSILATTHEWDLSCSNPLSWSQLTSLWTRWS